MKVLVVGKGGREHALCWKLAQSDRIEQLFCAPGSPGIAAHATCLPQFRPDLDISQEERLQEEIAKLRDWAVQERIDLTVVGPESALAGGIVDQFEAAGLLALPFPATRWPGFAMLAAVVVLDARAARDREAQSPGC